MPLRAARRRDDLIRFGLLDAAALALAALYLAVLRLRLGDAADAMDPAGVGTVAILIPAALAGGLLVAVSHSAGTAVLLCVGSGYLLTAGGAVLVGAILPRAHEAMGPAAMVFAFPALAGFGAVPVGLLLRLVLRWAGG